MGVFRKFSGFKSPPEFFTGKNLNCKKILSNSMQPSEIQTPHQNLFRLHPCAEGSKFPPPKNEPMCAFLPTRYIEHMRTELLTSCAECSFPLVARHSVLHTDHELTAGQPDSHDVSSTSEHVGL